MIIGEKFIFEVGDPVIDQGDAERRVGLRHDAAECNNSRDMIEVM